MKILPILTGTALLAAVFAQPASAQIKPQSSGQLSFNAPEMRRHGSGLYRPNRPHHHHRHHHRYHHHFFR